MTFYLADKTIEKHNMLKKNNCNDLKIFGGKRFFVTPKSTSNLVRPDLERFLSYSKSFFKQHQFTNNGPNVQLLEQKLAIFHQAEHCITFCNGFWALALAISALALQGKNEIIMPSLTYRRMDDISAWARLTPHFCEVEPTTLAMSAETVKPCINKNTSLILGVHPIVNCCDINGLVTLAKENDIPLLFDSVESVYESTASGKIGSFGDAEVFSLHASKFLNGFEGGYLTTNNIHLAEQLALMRGFGFKGADNIAVLGGMNAKLNEIHAAMALASLDSIDEQIARNRQRYQNYQRLLTSVTGIRLLNFNEQHQTSYKNIVIELLDEWPLSRTDTINILNAENILVRAYYSPPLHRNSKVYNCIHTHLPLTDMLSERFLNLPCGHFISTKDISDIVAILVFIFENAATINSQLNGKV